MPHLSPMNWIMSIMAFWTIMLVISSNLWWSQPNKFHSPKSVPLPMSSHNQWKW